MTVLARVINTELVDLKAESADFAGIYTPTAEFNKPKMGVTKTFLEDADNYFKRFELFDFTSSNLKKVFDHIGKSPHGVVLDMGAGFGNSTIPLLRNYPDIKVVASDISPNLLAILQKLTVQYGVSDRCDLVACDLLNDYFAPESVDMALGVAILHHLVDPMTLIRSSLKALKPGGYSVFMEPFAEGHFVLRSLFGEIINRYKAEMPTHKRITRAIARRLKIPNISNDNQRKAIDFLEAISTDIFARTARTSHPKFKDKWANLDDKWMFTRSYFYNAAKEFDDVSVDFINLHQSPKPYLAQMKYLLGTLAGLPLPDCLPQWAWDLAEEYEERYLNAELKDDFLIEGIIIMHRKA